MANDLARPTIRPDVLAALTDAAPARLVRKLEAEPTQAEAWAWTQQGDAWVVATDRGEQVRFAPTAGVVASADDVTCSCLLSPRCLHVLATVHVLALDDAPEPARGDVANDTDDTDGSDATAAGEGVNDVPDRAASGDDSPLSERQLAAARALWEAGAALLDHGAVNARMTALSELLRAVHGARIEGLHRAAAAGLRVAQSVRLLQHGSSAFRLEALSADLQELLHVSRALQHRAHIAASPAAWIGTARRAYTPRGSLRLFGLVCEPVVARTGYAGVAVTFADRDGQMWTVSDVFPGGTERVMGAYRGGIALGDVSRPPSELCRGGLFLQNAATSPDGRLSLGKDVRAVTAASAGWQEPALRARWEVALDAQLDRAWSALGKPAAERPAGWDLVFVEGVVLGTDGEGLLLRVPGTGDVGTPLVLRLVAPIVHEALPCRDNLRLLARAPGLALRVVGRVLFDAPHQLAALAIANGTGADQAGEGAEDVPQLLLPSEWQGQCNLGLDRLQTGHVSHTEARAVHVGPWADGPGIDPLAVLRRRLERLVYGGRMTLRAEVREAIEREAAMLERHMLPQGAALLRALATAGVAHERAWTGERLAIDPETLARCWLAGVLYQEAAAQQAMRGLW